MNHPPALHDKISSRYCRHAFGIKLVFRRVNAFVQRGCSIIVQDRNGLLRDDGAGIDASIHEMHRAARDFDAAIQCLFPRFKARERRQQGRMDVDNPSLECAEKVTLQDAHETSQDDQIHLGFLQRRHVRALGFFIQFGAEFPGRDKAGGQTASAGVLQDSRAFDVAQHDRHFRRNFACGDGVGDGDEV